MERVPDDKGHRDHRLLVGLGIIIVGLIFMSNNFGWLTHDIKRFIFRWEVVLIVLGLIFMTGRGNRTTGIILLFIGGIFYLRDFMHLHFSFWQVFWPGLLILTGLLIIFRHYIDRDQDRGNIISDDNHINEMAIFGGGDRVVASQQFQGGKVTTIFGGLNYNLLRAKLAPGENVIDVFCVFGGMTLIVPEGWNVKIRVMTVFGGFSDKHRYKSSEQNVNQESQLIIKGLAIFGGGEIKSFFD